MSSKFIPYSPAKVHANFVAEHNHIRPRFTRGLILANEEAEEEELEAEEKAEIIESTTSIAEDDPQISYQEHLKEQNKLKEELEATYTQKLQEAEERIKKAAAEAAREESHKNLETLLANIEQTLKEGLQSHKEMEESFSDSTFKCGLLIAKKLYNLQDSTPLREFIREIMDRIDRENFLTITLNPAFLTSATELLQNKFASFRYKVIADPKVGTLDCRIDWGTGYAEKSLSKILQEIEDL